MKNGTEPSIPGHKAEVINIAARIVAIADVFDALDHCTSVQSSLEGGGRC